MDSCLWSIPNLLPSKKKEWDGWEKVPWVLQGGRCFAEKLLLDHELTPVCGTNMELFSC